MSICLIQVPYFTGDESFGGSKGPGRLTAAGAATRGADVTVAAVERGAPLTDFPTASMEVSRQLEKQVEQALGAGQFPLVLAGSCDVSMGIVSAFDHSHCGIVWIDAHGDYNTPESSISGFFAGMSLAVLVGDCYTDLWAAVGNSAPIPKMDVLMLGIRDLDPAERERLDDSGIERVEWRDGQPQADVTAALDALAARVPEVYLHIDIDGLNLDIAPGVDYRVPGGITLVQLQDIIAAVASRFTICAAAITAFNPDLDQDDKTAQTGLRIIDLLTEYAG